MAADISSRIRSDFQTILSFSCSRSSERSEHTKTLTCFTIGALSKTRARVPNSGAQKVHSIGCFAMPEALIGSRWI
jgi:hypothetical protein